MTLETREDALQWRRHTFLMHLLQRLQRRFTFTRSGALAAARHRVRKGQPVSRHSLGEIALQLVSIAVGSSLIGVAVALLVRADLGLAPLDVMLSALAEPLGLTLGQSAWLVSGILFAIAAWLGRRPSPTGIVFVVANGLAVDVAIAHVRSPDGLVMRWGFVAGAIVVLALGVTIVLHSGTTGGAFDLLMLAGADRGIDRFQVRTALELGVLTVGVLGGGRFGPATLVFALGFGQVMRTWTQVLLDHRAGRAQRHTLAALAAASEEGERDSSPSWAKRPLLYAHKRGDRRP